MDEKLREYATPGQWEALCAIWECGGSPTAAARKLGKDQAQISRQRDAVIRKAAMHGYAPDYNLTHPVAPGFRIKGTSTLYDKASGEAKIQWIKTTVDEEQREKAYLEFIEGLSERVERSYPVVTPDATLSHLLTVYPVADHHLGMYASGEETGDADHDLKRGERLLCGAMETLVERAPESQQATIAILGDFFHYDSHKPVTPTHGHLMDTSSRFHEVVRAAGRSLRFMIGKALEKHERVSLIVEMGNHDISSSLFLREMFAALYENEERVYVDNSPRNIHVQEFGKNLICTHHGDKVKPQDLALVLATDFHEMWGRTKHRYAHTCHDHHDRVKEVPGMTVEGHRILVPADAHSSSGPWRSKQSMKSIVYHAEYGEVARHTVTPAMLEK